VLFEVSAMRRDYQISQMLPLEDKKAIATVAAQLDEDADEMIVRNRNGLTKYLAFPVEGDFDELAKIKLPRALPHSLDLDEHVISVVIRSDNVVVGEVSCEGGGHETLPAKFGGD
jgi:hypothetical protein